jgi:hypothetical protein
MGYKTQVRNMDNKPQEESGDWERLREKIMRATGCSDEEKVFDPAKTPASWWSTAGSTTPGDLV